MLYCRHVGGAVLGVCAESIPVWGGGGGGGLLWGRNYLDMSFAHFDRCN